jgi:alpha-tubulin suppressor-like RCC1 family protein
MYTVALTEEGRVVCWGSNRVGQCNVPPGLRYVKLIRCGSEFTAAVTSEGKVICWGDNSVGQCNVPSDVDNVVNIQCGWCRPQHTTLPSIVTAAEWH